MESLFQVVIYAAKDWGFYHYGRRDEQILEDKYQPPCHAKDFTCFRAFISWVFIDNSYLATLLQSLNGINLIAIAVLSGIFSNSLYKTSSKRKVAARLSLISQP